MQSHSSGGGTWGGSSVPSSSYMGGSPGDGLQGSSWSATISAIPQEQPPMGSNSYGQTQQSARSQQPVAYSPGSITQFAPQSTPPPAQPIYYSNNNNNNMADQTYQPQSSVYSVASSVPAPGGSYAARSAQAYATTGSSVIPQQQQQYQQQQQQQQQHIPMPPPPPVPSPSVASVSDLSSSGIPAQQDRILTDCTRRVQEHAYYMRQAMEQDELATVLDRAAYMVGELGGAHGQPLGGSGDSHLLTPKNYYELHIRALEEMPNLEEYLFNKAQQQQQQQPSTTGDYYSMLQLYDYVQFCPQVLSRLYLQICAGSALIRSKEVGAKWVLNDIAAVTRCVQNPTRGLFLRHFLLQAFRDKLPDNSSSPTDSTTEPSSSLMEAGTVKDAYEFVLSNFVEMNKLWVRLQHLPGEGKSKEQRKRRERERNDLRVLVGMNLVRLSQLEGVTSRIYGEVILPEILGQIVACGDPLAQAYLMDCIIQVFPDEYHIETLPILLNVCPKLRDKVNIRTILQSLMDRLSNYYAEEELLDESDSNQVKKSLARDSLPLFEECVQNVYNARGPKLTCKEVIRLQTALLNFSLKSSPGNMEQFDHCLQVCAMSLRQAIVSYNAPEGTVANIPADKNQVVLDEAAAAELDKLLAIVVDSLALKVLDLTHFSALTTFLPWQNRRVLAVAMLRAVVQSSATLQTVHEVEGVFNVISPIFERPLLPPTQQGSGFPSYQENDADSVLVARLIHLLHHEDAQVAYDMLLVAKQRLSLGQPQLIHRCLVALVFAALRLADKLCGEQPEPNESKEAAPETTDQQPEITSSVDNEEDSSAIVSEDVKGAEEESTPVDIQETTELAIDGEQAEKLDNGEMNESDHVAVASVSTVSLGTCPGPTSSKPHLSMSARKLFVFMQQTIAMVAAGNGETAFKLYLQVALSGDRFALRVNQSHMDRESFELIAFELLSQAFSVYDESITDVGAQNRCIVAMVGGLLACRSLGRSNYDALVTKTAQLAARTPKRQDQCQMVVLCANLFFPIGRQDIAEYSNPQRALECLQRALKLADSCTSSNPLDVRLFVDILDQYVFFFEHNNPLISDAYIAGLISLIRAHLESLGSGPNATAAWDAREQFQEVVRYIKRKKEDSLTMDRFSSIQIDF